MRAGCHKAGRLVALVDHRSGCAARGVGDAVQRRGGHDEGGDRRCDGRPHPHRRIAAVAQETEGECTRVMTLGVMKGSLVLLSCTVAEIRLVHYTLGTSKFDPLTEPVFVL